MRLPSLDDRLACAAELFPACAYGADIGADHGRLSCVLLSENQCARMCVADISADSLAKARRLLQLHGVSERADFCVMDGLDLLPRPAQAIAILGMGGHTLSRILLRGQEKLQGAALVLSAHTQIDQTRAALMQLGYRIDEERIAHAAGRFYVVLRAVPGEEPYDEKQLTLGPRLMETHQAHYTEYLAWRIGVTARERTPEAAMQLKWLKEEYARVGECTGG